MVREGRSIGGELQEWRISSGPTRRAIDRRGGPFRQALARRARIRRRDPTRTRSNETTRTTKRQSLGWLRREWLPPNTRTRCLHRPRSGTVRCAGPTPREIRPSPDPGSSRSCGNAFGSERPGRAPNRVRRTFGRRALEMTVSPTGVDLVDMAMDSGSLAARRERHASNVPEHPVRTPTRRGRLGKPHSFVHFFRSAFRRFFGFLGTLRRRSKQRYEPMLQQRESRRENPSEPV